MSESAVDEFDDDQQLQNRRLYIYKISSSQCRKLIRLHADATFYMPSFPILHSETFVPDLPFRDLHSRICTSI